MAGVEDFVEKALTSSFKEEEDAHGNSTSAAWKRFMEFFDGPITGLTFIFGPSCTCMFVAVVQVFFAVFYGHEPGLKHHITVMLLGV